MTILMGMILCNNNLFIGINSMGTMPLWRPIDSFHKRARPLGPVVIISSQILWSLHWRPSKGGMEGTFPTTREKAMLKSHSRSLDPHRSVTQIRNHRLPPPHKSSQIRTFISSTFWAKTTSLISHSWLLTKIRETRLRSWKIFQGTHQNNRRFWWS